MRKSTMIWLIIATSLVVIGLCTFAAAMGTTQWDLANLNASEYATNTYTISEDFHSISIDTNTADIVFTASDNGSCKIVCYDWETVTYSPAVQNGMLSIHAVDEREWYEYIGINIGKAKITVYLPANAYSALTINESTGDVEIPGELQFDSVDITVNTGDVKFCAIALEQLKIKTSTGGILVENTIAGKFELSTSTGKITVSNVTCGSDAKINVSTGKTSLTDVSCENLISTGSTGDISMHNVIAAQRFSIQRSTGDVKMDGCDAPQISIETDTGDVNGTILTDKVFITQTSTGKVNVPKSTTGGKCEITTDTGDITFTVE